MKEEWRECPLDGRLEVSSFGRVRRASTRRVIESAASTSQYRKVTVRCTGRSRAVGLHRLVALAFHGEPPADRPHVNHINGIRGDNRAVNVEWVSPSENAFHRWFNKDRSEKERVARPIAARDTPLCRLFSARAEYIRTHGALKSPFDI